LLFMFTDIFIPSLSDLHWTVGQSAGKNNNIYISIRF